MTTTDLQLEGLVGPTHNYAGLSFGNVASAKSAQTTSNPRAAALQSLEKMNFLHALGVPVAIMPPQPRPNLDVLRRLRYSQQGDDLLCTAHADSPSLLAATWSASSMWTANSGTVTNSSDTCDGRIHITPANLLSSLHRVIEPHTTKAFLTKLFPDTEQFCVHPSLPVTNRLGDEGAANHMCLSCKNDTKNWHIFVYGAKPPNSPLPARFPSRQLYLASESIAHQHGIEPQRTIFLQQHPNAIDAGVFHNDVIAMSHHNFLAYHESAYLDATPLTQLNVDIVQRVITSKELTLEEAVSTYFFNAQIVSLPEGGMAIIFPKEVEEHKKAHQLAQAILSEENPIEAIYFLNLRESMKNGGGPACLRLRVPMTEEEHAAMHQGACYTPRIHQRLEGLISNRYRDAISSEDLLDMQFAEEALSVQADIMTLLNL